MVFFGDCQCLGAARAVGAGRAGGDHVERVAEDVAEHNTEDLRRRAPQREPAPLDPTQSLADGVDLDDVRPAAEQLPGDLLQLGGLDQRLLKQRAPPAREQKQYCVLCGKPLHQRKGRGGAGKAVLIRYRVAPLKAAHSGDLAPDMAVFGHHHPAVHPAEGLDRRPGHLPGRLAGRDQQCSTAPGRKFPQRPPHRLVRQHRPQALPDDPVCVLPQLLFHISHLLLP